MIILDFGSGNSSKNDVNIVKRMIDELVKVDSRKHTVVIKWQLFFDAPPNIPLRHDVFRFAYKYAKEKGYQTTASVFDADSLQYLLTYDIPFVKIANRPDLYWLSEEVPRKIPVYISYSDTDNIDWNFYRYNNFPLLCVSEYPATMEKYVETFSGDYNMRYLMGYGCGISDHTADFQLYHKYKPSVYEVHYRLADSTGPDAGSFSRLPSQLSEIL